jgi:transcriptional regulator with XRE-family HTH domain
MSDITRTARLRRALGETQDQFAERIGVSQGTVWRLEAGQAERGPVKIILDRLESELAAPAHDASPSSPPSEAS